MKIESVAIKLKAVTQPICLTTARRVSFSLMGAVKAGFERMVTSGVIRAVTEHTDWCLVMVPVIKNTGAVRICVDLKQLNTAVRRELFMLPSLEDISPKLAASKVVSTLDAADGFSQIPIDEESQLLTTFITSFGPYAHCRLPFGISSAPEIFQRKTVGSSRRPEWSGSHNGRNIEEHHARLDAVIRMFKRLGSET